MKLKLLGYRSSSLLGWDALFIIGLLLVVNPNPSCSWLFRKNRRVVRLPDSFSEAEVHSHFMDIALDQARIAGTDDEVPIGAIVVQRRPDGSHQILSQARNMVEQKHDASAHAELIAMRKAAKHIQNWRLQNTTLYSTLEPCPMCLAASQSFRVSRIVYGAPDLRLGAVHSHIQLLDTPHPFHNIEEVVSDVNNETSANLLREFFRQRRKKGRHKKPRPSGKGLLGKLRPIFRSRIR